MTIKDGRTESAVPPAENPACRHDDEEIPVIYADHVIEVPPGDANLLQHHQQQHPQYHATTPTHAVAIPGSIRPPAAATYQHQHQNDRNCCVRCLINGSIGLTVGAIVCCCVCCVIIPIVVIVSVWKSSMNDCYNCW